MEPGKYRPRISATEPGLCSGPTLCTLQTGYFFFKENENINQSAAGAGGLGIIRGKKVGATE